MKSLIAFRPLVAAIVLAALVACGQSSKEASGPPETATQTEAAADKAAPAPASAPMAVAQEATPATEPANVSTTAQLTSSAATYTDAQRKFIRTAHVEFRVKDVYVSALAIEDLAAAQGGFVVQNDIGAQTTNARTRPRGDGKLTEVAEYTLHGSLVVRVPTDHIQAFLRALAGQVDFLDQRRFEAADAQFDMLRQQLAGQRAQESQLELAQAAQQGGRLNEKVEVAGARDAAKNARDEALLARKQFEDRVAFATIDLSIYQTPRLRVTELVDRQAEFERIGPAFGTRLVDSLHSGWRGLLSVVVTLAAVWPFWLLVLVILGLLRLFSLRKNKP